MEKMKAVPLMDVDEMWLPWCNLWKEKGDDVLLCFSCAVMEWYLEKHSLVLLHLCQTLLSLILQSFSLLKALCPIWYSYFSMN